MIYIDTTLEQWFTKYPALNQPLKCLCGKSATGLRPYRTTDYAGVMAENCPCGRGGSSRSSPVSQKSINAWKDALGAWGIYY